MSTLFRRALGSLFIVAASNASAGVITQDGVVFTSTYDGNVLTLEIDAANRSGGWAAASAIDALSLKTIGSFSDVAMRSSSGTAWSLVPGELNAHGCAAARTRAATAGMTRLCYAGADIALADNMLFTFTFSGTPSLSAPHLKVHFVDAQGSKVGSLLSLDFPWQAASAPGGASAGPIGGQAGSSPAQELIPAPPLSQPLPEAPAPGVSLPAGSANGDGASDVPEPRTLALMAAGLALLGVTRRRK